MTRTLAAVAVAAACLISASALLLHHKLYDRVTPSSQPALARLGENDLGPVRDQFNASVDVVRVLVMLSPT